MQFETRGVQQQEPTTDLVREAVEEVRDLVRVEIALAREEMRTEIKQAKIAAVGFSVGGVLAICGLTMLLVALALAIDVGALAVFLTALVVLAIAAGAAFFGYAKAPKKPLAPVKDRVTADVRMVKEHIKS